MDYSSLVVPFINKDIIKRNAEIFREKYWGSVIPVNIEKVIESKLDIQVIPIPNLENFCNTDALITSDWSSIYVDNDTYKDERYYNRLRFSFAHEIGHFVMHKKIYESLKLDNYEKFYSFLEQIPNSEYQKLETQAHMFAGFFLVPRENLKHERELVLRRYKDKGIDSIDDCTLNAYIANPLSKIFGVSAESMQIILNNENFG